jgi:hypothetical protein
MSATPSEEEIDYHAELDVLRRFCPLASQVVEMVDDRERVILALTRLSKLDRFFLERWSDPNYG